MATQITNTASATYSFTGGGTDNAVSNEAVATLLDEYAISGTKTSNNTSFRPNSNITYIITVKNTGTGTLYNVNVTDNLGGGTPTVMSFVTGSGRLIIDGTVTTITPTSTSPSLVFALPNPLQSGETAIITFVTLVSSGSSIQNVTNEASITANGGSTTGPSVSVDVNPSITLPIENYALVSLYKEVSTDTISVGSPFTYTFSLRNSGNSEATNVVITDVLPENFTISEITVTTGGTTQTLTTSDYTYDSSTRTLTIPTGSTVSLTVPAKTGSKDGETTVNVTGTISS